MPKPRERPGRQPRLLGVQLPRVQVKHTCGSGSAMFAKRGVNDREWELAEISATTGGNADGAPCGRRDGKLYQRAAHAVSQMWNGGRATPSVARAPDGEDA